MSRFTIFKVLNLIENKLHLKIIHFKWRNNNGKSSFYWKCNIDTRKLCIYIYIHVHFFFFFYFSVIVISSHSLTVLKCKNDCQHYFFLKIDLISFIFILHTKTCCDDFFINFILFHFLYCTYTSSTSKQLIYIYVYLCSTYSIYWFVGCYFFQMTTPVFVSSRVSYYNIIVNH